MKIEPYLFLEGRCEEAIEFYKTALGAEVKMMMRHGETPDPQMCKPGLEDKILHANLRIGDGNLMMSDGRCEDNPGFRGFSLSVSVKDASEAERYFDALKEGGKVLMPLAQTFYSPSFGMVEDRFGVMWMIIVV